MIVNSDIQEKIVRHLTSNEIKAITAYAAALLKALQDNLVELWLFGSKARGDFDSDSDIDLLAIVRELPTEVSWQVQDMAADYSLEYDVLFNIHMLDSAAWEEQAHWCDTLWREVQRDGIALTTQTSLPQSR